MTAKATAMATIHSGHIHRHDERDEHAADEESLVDGVPVHARDDELDAQADA